MVKLLVINKAYFGGILREAGEVIEYPDDRYAERKPSWAVPDPKTAFGGKGDHDGDGFVGGSKPREPEADEPAKGKRGRKPKAETVHAPTAAPFADAPTPQTIAEAQKEIGGIAPDWLPPDAPKPVDD